MDQVLRLSQGKINDFLACQRRFQLRYREHLAWPLSPLEGPAAEARDLGQRFHQILQRHFLDLPIEDDINQLPTLARWWQTFKERGPALPAGSRYPELSMTVPIGRFFLTGRFDLLVAGTGEIQLFDWKTNRRPPPKVALQNDLQTQLYLWLAAEGASALNGDVEPRNIALNYWYVNDPDAELSIEYDQSQHEDNWRRFNQIVQDVETMMPVEGQWPLTVDLENCTRCAYQVYCGRQTGQLDLSEWEPEDDELYQEPARS